MYYNKFTRHEQVRLIRLRFEREKYLSKRSLIKHTCPWRVNFCIMNTEQTSKNIVL